MVILTLFTLYPIVWLQTVELDKLSLSWEMSIFASLDITAKLILTCASYLPRPTMASRYLSPMTQISV